MSRWMGYGSVDDVPAEHVLSTTAPKVTLYTANVCPFCPIVRRRLLELKQQISFELDEVDVTFQPQIVLQKGSNHASIRVMKKLGMTHNTRDDFDHPGVPEGDPLRRHVLCRLTKARWRARSSAWG